MKKEGAGYDLPIALGILAATGTLQAPELAQTGAIGELSLDGAVRTVPGILPMILAAREQGIGRFFVPEANAREAAVIEGVDVIPVRRLHEAVEALAGITTPEPARTDIAAVFREHSRYPVDFAEVRGQESAKRAFEIAAAGGHNLLMSGVPGSGKTMMARRLPTILPGLNLDEAIESTKIYSTSGLLPTETPLLATRPFRSPHHTISDAGLIGGGHIPRPGEVSLAHNGVLFLDELPEFRKNVLEVMRQPLEDGVVTIARAATSLRFPARFMLVAAMNPCKCHGYGDPQRPCTCTPHQIHQYQSKISGPLLDRIDIHIEVPAVKFSEVSSDASAEPSSAIRERVTNARAIQYARFKSDGIYANAHMKPRHIRKYCKIDEDSLHLMEMAMNRLGLSARAYNRILKVARTIADLEEVEKIASHHIKAIQYRSLDRRMN